MPPAPDLKTFLSLAEDHELVPVYRCLLSDSLTPVSAFHKLDEGGCACLFESVVGGEKVGRHSFLAVSPFRRLRAWGQRVQVFNGQQCEEFESDNPLQELRSQLQQFRVAQLPELPPFAGGAIGYAGYDVVRYSENLPAAPEDDRDLPDLSFDFYDQVIVFDHVNKTITVIVMARLDDTTQTPTEAYEQAQQRLNQLVDRLSAAGDELPCTDICVSSDSTTTAESNFSQQQFHDAVEQCVEYIRAGDVFQVVISQRWALTVSAQPFEIYRSLRVVNPSPFMFFLRTDEVTLVGSSPEIMCRVVDNKVTVRPLAGTRPRGRDEAQDQQFAEELLADPKECAEHVMLVDLGRNDVGRVADYGTVELSDVMVIERYSHVMHITSNVTADLREGKDAFDALAACLPAGTVSGAPKVRAMEIIDELEPHRRGPYAGAVGYVDYAGNMDTCIALRTLVIQGDRVYVQAGAGIVADSVPESEYQETLNKAQGLLQAIEITERRCRS